MESRPGDPGPTESHPIDPDPVLMGKDPDDPARDREEKSRDGILQATGISLVRKVARGTYCICYRFKLHTK